jgi:phospholipid/cholesterol/gamma-HCH transport system permease protein
MAAIGRDLVGGVSFLGGFIAALGRTLVAPWRFRWPALVKQIEAFGFRSVPIIALISFLVGGIIAQQSVFQLRSFGTAAFVADLLGILILRELGVLLTSIMIAGRSGSAITAELGSMKMREEIDALRTMGLDPMEVLIVPRILALIICLPILTFIASMAGLLGGGLVAWFYGDVSPDVFLSRLQNAITMNTFLAGMYKAPVMALVIGLIASIEGMAVKGSAESLGQQTTASVVKAIFMVIVVDGLFAMFFAAIRF